MSKRLEYIITLVTTSKNNSKKDDGTFGTILRRVENRMSGKILSGVL